MCMSIIFTPPFYIYIFAIGNGKVFTRIMRQNISSGQWLGDEHMKLAQNLLKEEYPHLSGFQSTLLSQNNGFYPVQGEIHHIDDNHWVTSSSIGNEVAIYDSKFVGGNLSPSLTRQLALLYRTWSEENERGVVLSVVVPNVQQQFGVNDCGLFAIAFAVHAALGQNVENLEFDQAQMRDHLMKCFSRKRMFPFPILDKDCTRHNFFRARDIELYCECLMPDYGDMIGCDKCDNWFHFECTDLIDLPGVNDTWHCRKCSLPQ